LHRTAVAAARAGTSIETPVTVSARTRKARNASSALRDEDIGGGPPAVCLRRRRSHLLPTPRTCGAGLAGPVVDDEVVGPRGGADATGGRPRSRPIGGPDGVP